MAAGRIHLADNMDVLRATASETVDLIYIDPPFNTGRRQRRKRVPSPTPAEELNGGVYVADRFEDYLAFLGPRLEEARRVLKPSGSLYVHLDPRESHYVKVFLDGLFGRASFINEIVWVYDFGGRARDRWPAKHDAILYYAKDPALRVFNADDIDREPYMSPGFAGPEKAARGKLPTDSWWHTIVGTNSREKTGYPTQKPLGVVRRIVRASSRPGDLVMDFFAGSGTTGAACLELGRRFELVDSSEDALRVMLRRFEGVADIDWIGGVPGDARATGAAAD